MRVSLLQRLGNERAFEVAVAALMKVDHDGHYLAGRKLALATSALQFATELVLIPLGLEHFSEIIDMAE